MLSVLICKALLISITYNIGLDKSGYQVNIFFYFSMKTCAAGTQIRSTLPKNINIFGLKKARLVNVMKVENQLMTTLKKQLLLYICILYCTV